MADNLEAAAAEVDRLSRLLARVRSETERHQVAAELAVAQRRLEAARRQKWPLYGALRDLRRD